MAGYRTIGVLLIEDDDVDAEGVKRHLQNKNEKTNYTITHVKYFRDALTHLAQEEPDVVLLDMSLPDSEGIRTLARLREANAKVPVIVFTGRDDEHLAIESLQHGAQDFIVKGMEGQNPLSRSIHYAIERQAIIQQWKKAEQVAAAASEAKSIFLAQMSHEIRTPLTAILGFTELAISPESSPECRKSMETVRRNAEHLLEVIDDILDISKIEAGRFEIETMEVQLLDLVSEIASSCQLKASSKGLNFKLLPIYPLPARIWTDSTRLKQILFNLIGNAIKFTNSGNVLVTLAYDGTAKQVIFKVTDSGIGISVEDRKKLFGLFSQVDASTARTFGGTGLGLAISKRLAEMLGGTILVESEVGLGSTFTVSVDAGPICDGDILLSEEKTIPSLPNEQTVSSQPIFWGKVLIVDDMPDNRELLSYFLRATGIEVGEAANGQIALELAKNESWDLVLLDMQMPLVDGKETARQLRARGFDKPIVAVTASAMDGALAKCLDAGCDEYLRKPFKRADLYKIIGRYLGSDIEKVVESAEMNQVSELLRDEPGLARPIFSFVNNYASRIQSIEHEWQEKNFERLKFLAHSLRGATVFGFPNISHIAELLDEDLAASTFDRIPRLIEALKSMNRNVTAWKPEIQRIIDTLPPKP